jgi:carbonic anhydrase
MTNQELILQESALSSFVKGHNRFKDRYFNKNKELYAKLALAQTPKSILIGCCDSRVDPAIITDCNPGDIFVVRNVANLVAPYGPDSNCHGASSALEYAVKVLKVENIIILGHSKCGGIAALMDQSVEKFEFLGPWMNPAKKALEKVMLKHSDTSSAACKVDCETAAIFQSMRNLYSYPWIKERIDNGELEVSGWYFDIETGDLKKYCKFQDEFVELGREYSQGEE